jgi:TPR repeat protein
MLGVPQNLNEALHWYRLAAEQNFGPAQTNLGLLYLEGRRVLKDPNQALKFFHSGAEPGNSKAFLNLAEMYYGGNGMTRDPSTAYKWLRIANLNGESVSHAMEVVARSLTVSQVSEVKRSAAQWAKQHVRLTKPILPSRPVETVRTHRFRG